MKSADAKLNPKQQKAIHTHTHTPHTYTTHTPTPHAHKGRKTLPGTGWKVEGRRKAGRNYKMKD